MGNEKAASLEVRVMELEARMEVARRNTAATAGAILDLNDRMIKIKDWAASVTDFIATFRRHQ